MNIDNLISKYLDGELSEAEDLKLRNIITSNEKARDTFNSYIDLHIAAKEDAKSIQTPADLKSETEDLVLMNIMKATAAPAKVSKGLNIFNLFPRQLASMVAVFLLISFTYTADFRSFEGMLPTFDKPELSMSIPVVKSNDVTNEMTNVINSSSNIIRNSNALASSNNVNEENESNQPLSISSNNELISSVQIEKEITSLKADNSKEEGINSGFSSLSEDRSYVNTEENYDVALPTINLQNDNTSTSNMQFGAINDKLSLTQNNLAINNIQLTAYSSNPYTLFGFDKDAEASLKAYSQAISISVNSKTRVGLEIGFSDIAYRSETFTSTRILDLYGRETGQQLVIRTERDKDYSLYWGQMFIQSELYKIENFDVGVRFGFGLSTDGFNTNSKLLASYEIIDGIKLTAGSEFTYFTVSLPQVVNAYTDNYYSFAMLYGLQFNF